MTRKTLLTPLALAAAALWFAGCGPPPDRTTVTGAHYSFTAPGSFTSVSASNNDFPEVEDRSTLTELRDSHGTEIYAAKREPSAGTSLADLLRGQRMVAQQGFSGPIPVRIAGRSGVRIDGLRPTGANETAIGSSSYAFRSGRDTFVIGCRWHSNPDAARGACDQVVKSFKPG